jgi:hypothetical protein
MSSLKVPHHARSFAGLEHVRCHRRYVSLMSLNLKSLASVLARAQDRERDRPWDGLSRERAMDAEDGYTHRPGDQSSPGLPGRERPGRARVMRRVSQAFACTVGLAVGWGMWARVDAREEPQPQSTRQRERCAAGAFSSTSIAPAIVSTAALVSVGSCTPPRCRVGPYPRTARYTASGSTDAANVVCQ